VEKVKEVVVINNEFGINAIKVVSAKDGSLLYISCNRLVGMIYDDNLYCLKGQLRDIGQFKNDLNIQITPRGCPKHFKIVCVVSINFNTF
jgi:hypothetical protein